VTLLVTREAPVLEDAFASMLPSASEPHSVAVEREPVAANADPDPEPVAAVPEPTAEAEPIAEAEPTATPAPEPRVGRVGFFARFFGRRRGEKTIEVVELEPTSQPGAVAMIESGLQPGPEIEALAAPEPIYAARPVEPEPALAEPAADLAGELTAMEAQMAERTAELLTSVLDRLGAAHHRPFSRG
jgi:hypothetical protein